jgi:2-oxoglutarate ferredoxin oxidoreductase subunit gamma
MTESSHRPRERDKRMAQFHEIILAGTGGQGLALAGVVLAQSLAEEEGKNVLETEAYGISMRGGLSRSEILVSSEEINELRVTEPDLLLAMSREASEFYLDRVKRGGTIILDSLYVGDVSSAQGNLYSLPLTEEARRLGQENVANVIALGAIASVSRLIAKRSLENTLRKRFTGPMGDLNLTALDWGFELGERMKGSVQ